MEQNKLGTGLLMNQLSKLEINLINLFQHIHARFDGQPLKTTVERKTLQDPRGC